MTWLDVTDDELGEDIETKLNVGKSLDNTNGDSPKSSDDEGEDDGVPCHTSVERQSGGESETNHNDKKKKVSSICRLVLTALPALDFGSAESFGLVMVDCMYELSTTSTEESA